jgi:pyruvate kinase
MQKIKIVCTIGPSSRSTEVLRQLILAGMNVARLNFSHGSHSEHGAAISSIRRLSTELARPVAILQDLTGPKIRIGNIAAGAATLEPGSIFILTRRQVPGDASGVTLKSPGIFRDVRRGDTLLLSDGAVELEVLRAGREDIRCRVIVGGQLSSHKGIHFPHRSIHAPSLTEKDKTDLAFGLRQGVDYVALSFVREAADMQRAKRFIEKHGRAVPLIAKIEKHEALANIDDIIPHAAAVMVARGDLGVEISLENVPRVQKSLIGRCNSAGKPVITATQMLLSMVQSPRPTRAEVTDVANAILDGTDAIMLSEETAIGTYPVGAVKMMARIAEETEPTFPFSSWAQKWDREGMPLDEAVASSACNLAERIQAAAIITFTHSGGTARLVAKYRPGRPILAPTPLPQTYRRLALVWGVVPLLSRKMTNTDEMIRHVFAQALESGIVKRGQRVVITAGIPLGVPGTTNLIKAETLR